MRIMLLTVLVAAAVATAGFQTFFMKPKPESKPTTITAWCPNSAPGGEVALIVKPGEMKCVYTYPKKWRRL